MVADDGRETEAKVRLARIGFDRVRGAVVDIERPPSLHARTSPLGPRGSRRATSPRGVPTSRPCRSSTSAIRANRRPVWCPGARCMPLARLLDRYPELDTTAPTVVDCAAGYRSSTAAPLLRSVRFTQVADLQGGYDSRLPAT